VEGMMDLDKVKEQQYFTFRKTAPDSYSSYTIPQFMARVLPRHRSHKILDVGCGFGQTMKALRELGYEHLRGVDISDESIGHCKSIGLDVEKISDIGEYTAEHKAEYDFIIMSHVLEHIEKPLIIPYVTSIKAMLRQGGQFLIMVPNAQSNTDCYWAYEDFTHSTLFTAGSLYFVLMAGGFSQVEILDQYSIEGLSWPKRMIKLFLLKLYTTNKTFWNRVTTSSFHKPSPVVFSYEIKALAR
jgi:SAM-dependent methyltransferase